MQLVAYGVQDVYLTGNAQITYWKVIYKRHTNFAVEPIEQSFSGTADFGKTSVTSLIARNGDLITKVYLKARISASKRNPSAQGRFAWVSRVGHAMIRTAEIQIGGARIDLQYGEWMNIWWELTHEEGKVRGFSKMIGDTPELTELSNDDKSATLFVPLTFWFCRNNGLALPLIALQYHDVRINFNFNAASKLIVAENDVVVDAHIEDALLLIDYVFLDSEERKRFATSAHEYLIEQLQTPDEDTINEQNKKYRLPFNHPCKEIVWAVKQGKYVSGTKFVAYHASDFMEVKRRLAQTLFLLNLDITKSGSTWTVKTNAPQTATPGAYSTVTNGMSSVSAVQAVADSTIEYAALVTTNRVQVASVADSSTAINPNVVGNFYTTVTVGGTVIIQDDTAGTSVTLPTGFDSNPFDYVDFLDDNWQHIDVALASRTVAEMGFTQTSRDIYTLLSKWFVSVNQPFNYGVNLDGSQNPVVEANLQLNGQDRFTKREGDYFNYVQPWQCHSRTPADGINVYSFALNPEDHQPSGTCNFSRIDFSQLNIKLNSTPSSDSVISIYTVNYNILRIMGGMGGLVSYNQVLKVVSQYNFGLLYWVILLCSQWLLCIANNQLLVGF